MFLKINKALFFCLIAVLFFSCKSHQITVINKTVEVNLPGRKEGLKMFHYEIELISNNNSSDLKFDYASILGIELPIKIFNKNGIEISNFNKKDTIVLNCTLTGNEIQSSKINEYDLTIHYQHKKKNKKLNINKIQLQQTPIQP